MLTDTTNIEYILHGVNLILIRAIGKAEKGVKNLLTHKILCQHMDQTVRKYLQSVY